MPKSERSQVVPVRVPKAEYAKVAEFAKKERRSVSDLFRVALEDYMRAKGEEIDLFVARGAPMPDEE